MRTAPADPQGNARSGQRQMACRIQIIQQQSLNVFRPEPRLCRVSRIYGEPPSPAGDSGGVRSAECGVRSAECGVRSAECGVRSAECECTEMHPLPVAARRVRMLLLQAAQANIAFPQPRMMPVADAQVHRTPHTAWPPSPRRRTLRSPSGEFIRSSGRTARCRTRSPTGIIRLRASGRSLRQVGDGRAGLSRAGEPAAGNAGSPANCAGLRCRGRAGAPACLQVAERRSFGRAPGLVQRKAWCGAPSG
jgi:hypothetical protein